MCSFLLQSERCYKAEICAILFPLRCATAWSYFLQKSKFSESGQKPWNIIRRFDRNRAHSLCSFLLQSERCYKAEICTILFPLRCATAWYYFLQKSKFSESGQKPWTIIRRFDRNRAHSLCSFLLQSERCYKAEICAILFPLRCATAWSYFLQKSKFSESGQKPWNIIRRFDRNRAHSLCSFLLQSERCYKAEICTILFPLRCATAWYYFLQKSKFSESGQKPWTIIRRFDRNRAHSLCSFLLQSERCYKAEICTILFPLRCATAWY